MAKMKNNLKSYYDDLNDVKKKKIREKIIEELDISENNFYWRMRNFKWRMPDKKAVAKIVKQPIEVLFPENGIVVRLRRKTIKERIEEKEPAII